MIVPTTRDPISGRVRQVSATAHTKREAEELLSRMLSEVHGGQHGGPDVSMGELFERWYELASPDWSPKTALETRRYLDNYLIPHLGKVKVRKVTTASLDTALYEAAQERRAQGRAVVTFVGATHPRRGAGRADTGEALGLDRAQPGRRRVAGQVESRRDHTARPRLRWRS